MSGRGWLIAMAVVGALGAWYSTSSSRHGHGYAAAEGATTRCALPPRVAANAVPLQTPVPDTQSPFRLQAATLVPLAGFSVDARVLSRKDYRSGREAELAPTDLALGWGRMRDERVLSRLEISQSSRWFHYRYRDQPPLPLDEIMRSAANMHLIPSSDAVAHDLERVRQGDHVRVDGWLVEAQAADGWHWRSSTSREDSGNGACELVYVCAITRL